MSQPYEVSGWRRVSRGVYESFFRWTTRNQKNRMEEGLRKYRSEELGFQGDPLQHALEEILDALFYIFYAMRERDGFQEKLAAVQQRLDSMRTAQKPGPDEES